MRTFSEIKLSEPLARALVEIGYDTMTPVQAASLPAIVADKDVIAQAKTGSGKTAAFGLGLLSKIDPAVAQMQGLVLCPTRELADQVSREIRRLARFIPNVKVLTLCGGVPVRVHLASLTHQPHIAVGTPGRIFDLLRKDSLPTERLKVLVLDEADRMLDMGFADDIGEIVSRLPKRRQTLLFSATMPDPIRDFSRQFQRTPIDITIESETEEALIDQVFYNVESGEKLHALKALLLKYQPESALIFCNTRDAVRNVAEELSHAGFSTLAMHGELEQREREEMLVRFANRSCNILVASDVAGRGLDVKELAMVINFDLASDIEAHTHRIGRTGRAGSRGIALSLCSMSDTARTTQLAKLQGQRLRWEKVPPASGVSTPQPAPFVTLAIDAGRQDKLRPGDVLGALTGDAGLPGEAVGKIDVFPTRTYVAVLRKWSDTAVQRLRAGKVKGRTFRIRKISR